MKIHCIFKFFRYIKLQLISNSNYICSSLMMFVITIIKYFSVCGICKTLVGNR